MDVDQNQNNITDDDTTPPTSGKKPRGRPPKGKMWDDDLGDWKQMTPEEIAAADAAKPPKDDSKRPPGRTPKGKVWEAGKGWVESDGSEPATCAVAPLEPRTE